MSRRFRAGSSGEHIPLPHVPDPPEDCSMCLEVMQPTQKLFVWGCKRHRTHNACAQNYRVVHKKSPLPCPSCRTPTHVDCVGPPSIPPNTFEWLHAYINNLDEDIERISLLEHMPLRQRLTAPQINMLADSILFYPNLVHIDSRTICPLQNTNIQFGASPYRRFETSSVDQQNLICLIDVVQLHYLLSFELFVSQPLFVSICDYSELSHDLLEQVLAKHEQRIIEITLNGIKTTLKMPSYVNGLCLVNSDIAVDITNIKTPYDLIFTYTCSAAFLKKLPLDTKLKTLSFKFIDWSNELRQLLLQFINEFSIEKLMVNMCRQFFVSDTDAYDLIQAMYVSTISYISIYLSNYDNNWPNKNTLENYIENNIPENQLARKRAEMRQYSSTKQFRLRKLKNRME